ncbi:serine hydrolase [Euhalothece natronophila Z-M001]|uniref:Serine hydrolase n=1 Tax=Euhalothece natronophila Z-M001 TaxID=522448 RepID=A0A5B8NPJ2_9CHRO|nr:serine hydrolase [Euhalothece natronophila]QDZ40917.1 serine hydrolase [Euhalothece natronophila Z-M001]
MPFYQEDKQLQGIVLEILKQVWQQFPELEKNQIALTWLIYDTPLRGASYRGNHLCYPASLVKLFYLVAVLEWLKRGLVAKSSELDRAISDMIIDSSNDATSLVVDSLTGTTSGPELSRNAFLTWQSQRNLVNRYFQSLRWQELEGINVNQKTWGDGPYGRERAFVGEFLENRNQLTTKAVARLFHEIISDKAVSVEASHYMKGLLARSLPPPSLSDIGEENQITGFLGEVLPKEATLYSKAGWMSQVRHDSAYIKLPNCPPYLLVVFTERPTSSPNRALLPFISQQFLEAMRNQ